MFPEISLSQDFSAQFWSWKKDERHISIMTHFWGLWEHFCIKEWKQIHIWYLSILLHHRLIWTCKNTPKNAQNSNKIAIIDQNCAFSVLKSILAWKKFTSVVVPAVTNISYEQIIFTFSSPLCLTTSTNKQDIKHWANSSKKSSLAEML